MGASSSATPRPRWLAALDAVSLVLFAASALWLVSRVEGAPPPLWWIPLGLAAGAGLCAADVATGAMHWLFDRCFDESTPGLGDRKSVV